jgi:hypothetical protein
MVLSYKIGCFPIISYCIPPSSGQSGLRLSAPGAWIAPAKRPPGHFCRFLGCTGGRQTGRDGCVRLRRRQIRRRPVRPGCAWTRGWGGGPTRSSAITTARGEEGGRRRRRGEGRCRGRRGERGRSQRWGKGGNEGGREDRTDPSSRPATDGEQGEGRRTGGHPRRDPAPLRLCSKHRQQIQRQRTGSAADRYPPPLRPWPWPTSGRLLRRDLHGPCRGP